MKKIIWIIIAIIVFLGCNRRDYHIGIPENHSGIYLQMPNIVELIEDIHIYAFDSLDKLSLYKYYSSSDIFLSSEAIFLNLGVYNFLIVVNVEEDLNSKMNNEVKNETSSKASSLELLNLIRYLNKVKPEYPDILIGMTKEEIIKDATIRADVDVSTADIPIDPEVAPNALHLSINLPEGQLETGGEGFNRRVTAEIYKKGETELVFRISEVLNDSKLDLPLVPGNYDILLWVDNTPIGSILDHDYLTTQLKGITFKTAHNESRDAREAYSLSFEATVEEVAITNKTVTLKRSLAKYRIEATDIEDYKALITSNGYPPINDLIATIDYGNNFHNTFDLSKDRPTTKITASYSTNVISTDPIIGSDYIFVDGDNEAIIEATLTIRKGVEGKIITNIPIEIKYRRSQTAIISGKFLTAGVTNGIYVDIEWSEENNHDFN